MNVAVPIKTDQPAGLGILRDARALESVRDPNCAAAIWDRPIPLDALKWLEQLDPAVLPSGRVIVQPNAVPETARNLCDIAEMLEGEHRDWFLADVAELAELFAGVMHSPYLRLRLQAVTSNACRKFHIDAISGRLVCTYRGTGTQYGISGQNADPAQIFTTPTGAPILLRGSLWPPKRPAGFLHRSPPIEGTGETRLVLVLDPIFDLVGEE